MQPHAETLTAAALLAQEGGSMSLLEYVKAGGALGYVLLALSVLAVALIGRNLLALRRGSLAPPGLAEELSQRLRSGDLPGAAQACERDGGQSFLSGTMLAAIKRCAASPMGAFEARAAVEEAGQSATARLQRLNNGLGVLAAVGPMLGLLGTVIGMIGAFNAIGSLQGSARSTELARFMSLALVNTAQGLVVAVPCTVAFALFRQRIDRLASDVAEEVLERLAEDMAAGLARRGQAPRPAAPAPQRPAGAQVQ
jgi:biopolymer transport protein ExbB